MNAKKAGTKAREYDVVLWGATGFTGRLVAQHLLATYGINGKLRWAVAGRSEEKLQQLLQDLDAAALPVITAESSDRGSLDAMAARSRVICSTVGPYARYGTPLVAACVAAGTHYCDLTGEVPWMASIIEQFQEDAEASGARIVHSCGFDSIPSDMGTWFVQQAMLAEHGVAGARVRARIGRMRGAASGGTVASLLGVLEQAEQDKTVRKLLRNPYALNPTGAPRGADGPDALLPVYDPVFRKWTAPFVMAGINTRVVRRSNALLDYAWGTGFRYDESQLCRSRLEALAISAGLGGGMATMGIRPLRRLLTRLLPAPGEGPDKKAREAGSYQIFFHAEHPENTDHDLRARVSANLDPGYGSTSRMLGEAAVCLALDTLHAGGGIWTPASALGDALLRRLTETAGVDFALV